MVNYSFFQDLEKKCVVCGSKSRLISESLKVCVNCLRERSKESLPFIEKAQEKIRSRLGLPTHPPKALDGILCTICANECKIGKGETSYCGLKRNINGRLESLTSENVGILYSYLDAQVTNCCAAWFCPAGTGAGYPKYSYKPNPEYGYNNLAIFFYGCNFNCLFCQNTSHKNVLVGEPVTVQNLIDKTTKNRWISCWCYFGGSPEPQLPFAINASKTALE